MSIDISELSAAINRELESYRQEVTDGLKADVKQVSKECAAALKRTSPRKTGRYAKGWTVKRVFESETDIRVRVYNRTDWQLTHLLEYGHAIAGHGRTVGAKPHIGPAEQDVSEKLGRRVKVRVK